MLGQVGQFEGVMQHCLTAEGVHVIDLPVDYSASDKLQVKFLTQPPFTALAVCHIVGTWNKNPLSMSLLLCEGEESAQDCQ